MELREASTGKSLSIDETVFTFGNSSDEKWPYRLRIQLRNKRGKTLETEILMRYSPDLGRFRFKKGSKTEIEAIFRNDVFTIAHVLDIYPKRYAITLKEPLVYHNLHFFELDHSQAEAKFSEYVERVSCLKDVQYEKIPGKLKQAAKSRLNEWPEESVFSRTLSSVLTPHRFPRAEWIFCDDPGKEVADFIAANFSDHKVAFIHCKYGRGKQLSASVFHELCSQASKNLVYLRTTRIPPKVDTWHRKAKWEGTSIPKWIKGSNTLPEKGEMWQKIRDEILSFPRGQAEVWLVLGNGLDVGELHRLAGTQGQTQEVGPLLHLLDGLSANCAEARAMLRVFGH
jgi:hypothetical protein